MENEVKQKEITEQRKGEGERRKEGGRVRECQGGRQKALSYGQYYLSNINSHPSGNTTEIYHFFLTSPRFYLNSKTFFLRLNNISHSFYPRFIF